MKMFAIWFSGMIEISLPLQVNIKIMQLEEETLRHKKDQSSTIQNRTANINKGNQRAYTITNQTHKLQTKNSALVRYEIRIQTLPFLKTNECFQDEKILTENGEKKKSSSEKLNEPESFRSTGRKDSERRQEKMIKIQNKKTKIVEFLKRCRANIANC